MMDTSFLIVAQLEFVMINVPSTSKLAPSLTFERLFCHHEVAFEICVTPQDVTPILLLAGHNLFWWPESVLKVDFPMKNAGGKPFCIFSLAVLKGIVSVNSPNECSRPRFPMGVAENLCYWFGVTKS